jgi:hypothetical protein
MRRCRVKLGLALVALVALSSSTARAGDPVAAREQVKLGYTLAQEGKCDEALPHFVESLRLDTKAITLINLAACEEKLGKLADALGHWLEARARAQTEANSAIEEEASKKAHALESRIPKLTLSVKGASAAVEVVRDGIVLGAASMGVPLPVNPGPHVLVVRDAGHEDSSETISLAEGETKAVELRVGATRNEVHRPLPSEPAGTRRPLLYGGFGAAALGLSVGAVTGLLAFGRAGTASEECPHVSDCSQKGKDAVDSGRTFGTISSIAFVAAGAGAVVGTIGLLSKPTQGRSLGLAVSPVGGFLRGSF